jgi:hypothetical protein
VPLTQVIPRGRLSVLALLAALAALIDTIWGVFAVLGLDLSQRNELLMGITFVLGLPSYLLDLYISKRVAFGLISVFLLRWVACCFGGPTAVLCSPWKINAMIIVAFVLLETAKWRQSSS